jgi:hypothetical protein
MEKRHELSNATLGSRFGLDHRAGSLALIAGIGFGTYVLSDPKGHSVQPRPDVISILDLVGAPSKRQERRLKSVFDVVRVSEHTAANTQHHGPVTLDKSSKRVLIAVVDKPIEESLCSHLPGLHESSITATDYTTHPAVGDPPLP